MISKGQEVFYESNLYAYDRARITLFFLFGINVNAQSKIKLRIQHIGFPKMLSRPFKANVQTLYLGHMCRRVVLALETWEISILSEFFS